MILFSMRGCSMKDYLEVKILHFLSSIDVNLVCFGNYLAEELICTK